MREIRAPSNSVPESVLMVIGERALQRMFSQMLVAMKREIPEPSPKPFCIISSSIMTTIPAKVSCRMIRIAFPAPIVAISPYIPEYT